MEAKIETDFNSYLTIETKQFESDVSNEYTLAEASGLAALLGFRPIYSSRLVDGAVVKYEFWK